MGSPLHRGPGRHYGFDRRQHQQFYLALSGVLIGMLFMYLVRRRYKKAFFWR